MTLTFARFQDTPIDYEPPHFAPVAPENANFRITTSKIDEVPDLETLGSINTGFHGSVYAAFFIQAVAHQITSFQSDPSDGFDCSDVRSLRRREYLGQRRSRT